MRTPLLIGLVIISLFASRGSAVLNFDPCPNPGSICFSIKGDFGSFGGPGATITLPLNIGHGGLSFGTLGFDASITFDSSVLEWTEVRWLMPPDVSGVVDGSVPGRISMTVDWFINDFTEGDKIAELDFLILPDPLLGETFLDMEVSEVRFTGFPPINPFPSDQVQDERAVIFDYGDFDGNGTVDLLDFDLFQACFTGAGGGPVGAECAPGDFDLDGDLDCDDWIRFAHAWDAPGYPPIFPPCPDTVGTPGEEPSGSDLSILQFPNPFGKRTTFTYELPAEGEVRLEIYDPSGRAIRTLVSARQASGRKSVDWDGRDDRGVEMASGHYFYSLRYEGRRAGGWVTLLR